MREIFCVFGESEHKNQQRQAFLREGARSRAEKVLEAARNLDEEKISLDVNDIRLFGLYTMQSDLKNTALSIKRDFTSPVLERAATVPALSRIMRIGARLVEAAEVVVEDLEKEINLNVKHCESIDTDRAAKLRNAANLVVYYSANEPSTSPGELFEHVEAAFQPLAKA